MKGSAHPDQGPGDFASPQYFLQPDQQTEALRWIQQDSREQQGHSTALFLFPGAAGGIRGQTNALFPVLPHFLD